ncbi:MAG: hypothetical protein RL456_1122 [Pseudomonadota bacterium]|jgi:hypothetical protein
MKPIYYTFDELNAPTLNNAAGSLIAVLDAILVDGFNLKSVTSITIASGTATVVCTGHQFTSGRKVAIAGASVSALNDTHDITVVDANTFTFPTAATGTVTGTITAKRPPLGWTKPYSGTNTAMYQRTDPQATAMLLRVADTAAAPQYARAFGVESATDIDTYTGPFPTTAQASGGIHISKGANDSSGKRWMAVGDSKTVYLFSDDANYPWNSIGGLHSFYFGDVSSYRSGGDAYGCIIGGVNDSGVNYNLLSIRPDQANYIYLARPSSHLGGSILAAPWGRAENAAPGGTSSNCGGSFPSAVDGGMPIERSILVRENNSGQNYPIRGEMRGLSYPLATIAANGAEALKSLTAAVLSNWIGSNDSYLFAPTAGQGNAGGVLFNITSEW